MKNNE